MGLVKDPFLFICKSGSHYKSLVWGHHWLNKMQITQETWTNSSDTIGAVFIYKKTSFIRRIHTKNMVEYKWLKEHRFMNNSLLPTISISSNKNIEDVYTILEVNK